MMYYCYQLQIVVLIPTEWSTTAATRCWAALHHSQRPAADARGAGYYDKPGHQAVRDRVVLRGARGEGELRISNSGYSV
jgi:hypothetical protein